MNFPFSNYQNFIKEKKLKFVWVIKIGKGRNQAMKVHNEKVDQLCKKEKDVKIRWWLEVN